MGAEIAKNSHRIVWIDWAKAICIFLMVIGHWTSNETIILYIYSFHMPALFMISGMLFKPRLWYKTVLSLCVPVLFYSILNLLFLIAIADISIGQIFSKEVFFRIFHYRYGLGEGFYCGDWFLWALLGLRLFYGDIHFLSPLRKYYILLTIFVVVYMSFESHFISVDTMFRGAYIGRFVPSMPFFCLGFFLKDCNWTPRRYSALVVSLFCVLLVLMPIINGPSSINSNTYGKSYFLFFVFASLMSIIIFDMSFYLPKNNIVTVISNGTLLILGLHIPIMKTLDMIFPSYLHEFCPLFVLPICYFPIVLLNKRCPLLLGKV